MISPTTREMIGFLVRGRVRIKIRIRVRVRVGVGVMFNVRVFRCMEQLSPEQMSDIRPTSRRWGSSESSVPGPAPWTAPSRSRCWRSCSGQWSCRRGRQAPPGRCRWRWGDWPHLKGGIVIKTKYTERQKKFIPPGGGGGGTRLSTGRGVPLGGWKPDPVLNRSAHENITLS